MYYYVDVLHCVLQCFFFLQQSRDGNKALLTDKPHANYLDLKHILLMENTMYFINCVTCFPYKYIYYATL